MEQILTFTNKQGVEAFQQGKYYEAIAIWHEALKEALKIADADNTIINTVEILFNKARAYEKVGCLYLAQKGYDEVLKKEPHHTKDKEYLKTNEKLLENFKLETIRNSVQQFITLEGQSNDEIKISILKEMEQIEYGTLVRQFAYKKTADEVKNLVVILKDLGYLTTKLGELSGELKYYTDAAVFYQYVITILNEKLSAESKNAFIKQELVDPYQQLADIQQLIFSAIGGNQEKMPIVQEEAKTNKDMLLILRNRADFYMALKENYRKQAKTDNQQEKQKYQELYVNAARECFEDTADGMKKFLAKLYSDSEKTLTIPPPCKYAVIGLGSMALQQMTPYSDLEFAILTDNEDYQQSDDPKVREYFKNLSHLVNFKVINVAVNFDLGGKTPLGRIDQDKKYDLVQTVDGMMGYVRNEQHWATI